MKVETIVVGPYQENCYLVSKDNELLIIDPGHSFNKIDSYINGRSVLAILLTHGHLDHIGACDQLHDKYHCRIYGSEDDKVLFKDSSINKTLNKSIKVNSEIDWLEENKLVIGPFEIEIFYTPGHSNGSVMFKIEDCLFSGDTIFKNSIGRTDLYGGSFTKIKQSLSLIYQMKPNIVIYPGHEEPTTVGEEIQNNPYL